MDLEPAQKLTIVSVVTIAWNDRNGVRTTVESVREQTYPNIEHVIVDGGSSDGTTEFLKSLVPQPTWVSEKDRGRYDAMNKGIELSTGEIVIFMNSADRFHDADSVEILVESARTTEKAWGYGLSNLVSNGKTIAIVGRIPFDHARFLLGGNVVPHQAAWFSRSLLKDIGPYRIDFGLSADQELMVRASMATVPTTVPQVVCDFDATGAGSARPAAAHYSDMRRARRINNIRVTPASLSDSILGLYLWGGTVMERKTRSLVRRLHPVAGTSRSDA